MTRDREEADTFRLTQDALALTLGVRRVGITVAALTLQRFQPDNIDNRDVASAVVDQVQPLQCLRCDGDPNATNAQRERKGCVR